MPAKNKKTNPVVEVVATLAAVLIALGIFALSAAVLYKAITFIVGL